MIVGSPLASTPVTTLKSMPSATASVVSANLQRFTALAKRWRWTATSPSTCLQVLFQFLTRRRTTQLMVGTQDGGAPSLMAGARVKYRALPCVEVLVEHLAVVQRTHQSLLRLLPCADHSPVKRLARSVQHVVAIATRSSPPLKWECSRHWRGCVVTVRAVSYCLVLAECAWDLGFRVSCSVLRFIVRV